MKIQDQAIQEALVTISKVVTAGGGKALLVGGCVRDTVMGYWPRDFDVEVYGVPPQTLIEILSRSFPVGQVGEAFGVLKIHGFPLTCPYLGGNPRGGRVIEGLRCTLIRI